MPPATTRRDRAPVAERNPRPTLTLVVSLETSTELTSAIHRYAREIHARVCTGPGGEAEAEAVTFGPGSAPPPA